MLQRNKKRNNKKKTEKKKKKEKVIYSLGLRVLLEKHLLLPGSVSVGALRGCMFCEVESCFFFFAALLHT